MHRPFCNMPRVPNHVAYKLSQAFNAQRSKKDRLHDSLFIYSSNVGDQLSKKLLTTFRDEDMENYTIIVQYNFYNII